MGKCLRDANVGSIQNSEEMWQARFPPRGFAAGFLWQLHCQERTFLGILISPSTQASYQVHIRITGCAL